MAPSWHNLSDNVNTLCRRHDVIFIEGIPVFSLALRDEARRLVSFIDSAYETKSRLALSLTACVALDELFQPLLHAAYVQVRPCVAFQLVTFACLHMVAPCLCASAILIGSLFLCYLGLSHLKWTGSTKVIPSPLFHTLIAIFRVWTQIKVPVANSNLPKWSAHTRVVR